MGQGSTGEQLYPDGITIYGDAITQQELRSIIDRYSDIWNNKGGTVKIPEKDYMTIPLVQDWEMSYKSTANKVYPLGPKDREVIDKTFDKLHEQGRMSSFNQRIRMMTTKTRPQAKTSQRLLDPTRMTMQTGTTSPSPKNTSLKENPRWTN